MLYKVHILLTFSRIVILYYRCHLLQTETQEGMTPTIQVPVEDIFEDDDWEEQADKLYEWTQNLSLDELGVTSP